MKRSLTHLALTALACATLAACASTRTLNLRVESASGEPMPGAYVTASPLGISASPLPVSGENLRQVQAAPGVGAVADREGNLRLTIDAQYDHELRLQPPPMSDDARDGLAWTWIYRANRDDLTPADNNRDDKLSPTIKLK